MATPKRTPAPAGTRTAPVAPPEPSPVVATPAADAGPPAPVAPPPAGDRPDELFDARVLIAFDGHEPDAIVTATEAEIDRLWRDGKVDPHPDAVAFARSLAD